MEFKNLATQMGHYTAMLIKWNNRTLKEDFLNDLSFDKIWDLREESKKREECPIELKTLLDEKIANTEKTFSEWKQEYETYMNWYTAPNSINTRGKRIQFVFQALVKKAETFIDWSCIASLNNSLPYRDTAGRIDYSLIAVNKMMKLAKTFDEWKTIYQQTYNSRDKTIAALSTVAFAKMCELEKTE